MTRMRLLVLSWLVFAWAGCGGGSGATCTLGDPASCAAGRVCEEVQGGEPACFAPVHVEGRVLDARRLAWASPPCVERSRLPSPAEC